MCRYRPHRSLGQREVIRRLHRWAKKHFGDTKYRPHQKVSDALLVALHLSRLVYKHAYPSIWWGLLRETRPWLPSYRQAGRSPTFGTQAFTRMQKVLDTLVAVATPNQRLQQVVIDSAPLPVCRPKRMARCTFPEARWGYATQGEFYGFKLHVWITPSGQIVQYALRPANLHDTTVAFELNRRWGDFGTPKIIGDKGYCCLGFVFPPKKNTTYDTGWRPEIHGPMRKRVETVFSQLVEAHLRVGQLKTMASLRLKVVLAVLAHNLAHP
ncbi:IS982 family transposase [Deinococcus peraridilitoris]|nr:IS982 family transposase [Deinococcus peraridilitoris]